MKAGVWKSATGGDHNSIDRITQDTRAAERASEIHQVFKIPGATADEANVGKYDKGQKGGKMNKGDARDERFVDSYKSQKGKGIGGGGRYTGTDAG